MNISKILFAACAVLFCTLTTATAQSLDNPSDIIVGNWQPSNGQSVVQIYKGKEAAGEDPKKYYGRVIWLKEPNDPDTGQPKLDKNNPEEGQRKNPRKGLVIMKGVEFTGSKNELTWGEGTIYDPNNGSTYSFEATISTKNLNVLEGRGYIGVSLFGRTDTWKRMVKK
ncbi:DUF2147 domain-containing protein [Arundinibacter roseus]|uniref:DUF2147 domain-containing protein n=1 Tax=Arundinibacter roseus TaxID=2070510 RepID=A0A4R4KB06_9BACT|nr:DUF2147 domain-containing protein [Arundinibacter roseus]TDB63339.1 DUF2147 domain-containing protein [Arundinibacter roseus]